MFLMLLYAFYAAFEVSEAIIKLTSVWASSLDCVTKVPNKGPKQDFIGFDFIGLNQSLMTSYLSMKDQS